MGRTTLINIAAPVHTPRRGVSAVHAARAIVYSAFLLLLLALSGCDTDVAPVLGTDQPYTLFGVISPQLDTQRVLVFPIESELRLLSEEPLDALFSSTNLESRESLIWTDSIIPRPNGEVNHMYWYPFKADFGTTYEIEVASPKGTSSSVRVRVPPESEVVLQEPDLVSDVILPVSIPGDIPQLINLEAFYGFDYRLSGPGEKMTEWIIPQANQARRTEQGWEVRINLSRDFRTIRDVVRASGPLDLTYGIELQVILLRMVVANEAWMPPDGVFDPDVLVQPGTMSNVQNGFGFVGAGYRLQRSWLPPDSIVAEAGFRVR